jgi:hypothetical protein
MKYLLILLVIAGCNGGGTVLRGSGEPVMPPYGYEKLCAEYPTNPACTP